MLVDLKDRIWGVDVSKWQDIAETEKLPDMKMLADNGCRFVIARSTDGGVTYDGKPSIDRLFHYFIEESLKNNMLVANYPYMNYWSHSKLGMNSTQWGIQQGLVVAEAIKPYGYMRSFMDLETSPYAPTKIEAVWGTAITIMDNEVKVLDEITGLKTGIYGSTGRLDMFYDYHRARPLFAANYNDVTEDYVKRLVLEAGFTNLRIIQANSLGDIDGDKIPDGLKLGMENKHVDIDLFIGDETKFDKFFKGEETGDVFAQYQVKVLISNLIIRSEPIQAEKYDTGKRATLGGIYEIVEELGGYGRIPSGEWIYVANPQYVERLAIEQPPDPADNNFTAERWALVWNWYKEQHGG